MIKQRSPSALGKSHPPWFASLAIAAPASAAHAIELLSLIIPDTAAEMPGTAASR